jgi:O-antigen/teichoic acid export membrane protein
MRKLARLLNRFDPNVLEVMRGSALAFSMKVLGAGMNLSFNAFLARLLGASGSGIYFLALTVITFASVFGRLGLDNALIRFVAANAAQGDWNKVAGLYHKGLRLAAIASLSTMTIVLISAPFLATTIFSEEGLVGPIRLMALGILPMSLLILHSEMLKGVQRVVDAMLVNGIGVPLFCIPLLAVLGRLYSVPRAVLSYAVATVLTLMLAVFLWRKATPQLKHVRGDFDTNLLMRTSLPLLWVASMNLVITWTSTILLGVFADGYAVGIYGVAMRIALLTSFILTAVNNIVAPKFAALYAKKDYPALGALARHSVKFMTIISMPFLLVLVAAPEIVLSVFGAEFISGGIVLAILSIGQFVNVATGSVGNLLIMSGHEKAFRNNMIFVAIFNALMNFILIPPYGVLGAAIATASSVALQNVIAVLLVYKHLSIKMWRFVTYGS